MTNARVRSAIEVLLGYLCKIEVIDRAVQSYRSILHFHLRSGPIDQEHMLHCFNLIKKKRSWRISPARTLCFSFVAFVFVKSAYLCTASTYWNACIVFSWHHPPARSCDHAGKVYDAQILLVAQDGNFSGFMDPPPPAAPNVPYNTLDMNMGGRGYHGPGSGVNRQNRWILQLEKSKDLPGRLTCYELADNSASTLRARPGCFQVIGPGANYQQGRQKKVKRGADMHELCTLSWGIVCFPLLNRRTSLYPVASSSHQS
jgi:hypothetical protein